MGMATILLTSPGGLTRGGPPAGRRRRRQAICTGSQTGADRAARTRGPCRRRSSTRSWCHSATAEGVDALGRRGRAAHDLQRRRSLPVGAGPAPVTAHRGGLRHVSSSPSSTRPTRAHERSVTGERSACSGWSSRASRSARHSTTATPPATNCVHRRLPEHAAEARRSHSPPDVLAREHRPRACWRACRAASRARAGPWPAAPPSRLAAVARAGSSDAVGDAH